MHFLSRATAFLLVVMAFLLSGTLPAGAAETASADTVIIREDVVVEGDLYASGFRILIEGEIMGDLVALAGEELIVSGTVHGSVFALTQEVTISGHVGGSVRSVASGTTVSGTVGRDLVVVGVRVDLIPEAAVAGDVLIWAWNASLEGQIAGDLNGVHRNLDLAGSVRGDVDVSVSSLDIVGPLEVGGDLAYRSGSGADGLDDVDVGGVVVQKKPLPANIRFRALGLLARILTILLLAGLTMLIAMTWPDATEHAASLARQSMLKVYAVGLAILLSPLLLVIAGVVLLNIVPASASLPLIAVIIPLALALVTLVLLTALIAGTPAVVVAGRLIRSSSSIYAAVAIGSGVVGLAWLLPWIGWVVPLVVLPLGIGSWVLTLRLGTRPASPQSS